jgi:hypothetical protein
MIKQLESITLFCIGKIMIITDIPNYSVKTTNELNKLNKKH